MKAVFLTIKPDGELYGFPKQVPNELIVWYGGNDYGLKPEWRKWASEVGGYPKVNGINVEFAHFMQDRLVSVYHPIEDDDIEDVE